MIPKWLFELTTNDRLNSAMNNDEHGRPIEEAQELPNLSKNKRAYPGYKQYPLARDSPSNAKSTDRY